MKGKRIDWWVVRHQSLALAAREAGFDLAMFWHYSPQVRAALKSSAIKRVHANLCEAFEETTDRSLSSVVRGVYIICLAEPFTVQYEGRQSSIIYVGRGNISGRLKSHLENSLFDVMMGLAGADFDFYLSEPLDDDEEGMFKQLEHDLLMKFREIIGHDRQLPLLNAIHGSDQGLKLGLGWNKPLKASGKNRHGRSRRRVSVQSSCLAETVHFLIADSFTDALARLPVAEQKVAKLSAVDLQLDPSSPGLQFHRIDRSKDPNFWSMRVNRDLRIIVHKTADSVLLAYVDHHDKAYAWAERRRIEAHPKTGAVQIVEVRERVEEAVPQLFHPARAFDPEPSVPAAAAPKPLFAGLSDDELLSVGTPPDWLEAVRSATEGRFFDLAAHLPAEAAEALLAYAAEGVLRRPEPAPAPVDPFAHPDARRRFRVVENQEELEAALDAPWDKWSIFLHPSQRDVVERRYGGPARVAGSAGTGKTVVAVHRAVRLAKAETQARVLLTTLSQPLADALRRKVDLLAGSDRGAAGRITVAPWQGLADELHQLAFGRRPRIANEAQVAAALKKAAKAADVADVSERFLLAEFTHVVDAWQVGELDAYAETPRLGRKTRLGARQRERLWPVFVGAREDLARAGWTTWPAVFGELTAIWSARADKPFAQVVVDEAQDLGVPELRLLSVLTPGGDDALFFAGDLGQRIFQPPFSWKALGIDVRGRSTGLKVNYRTSHQIREAADRLLPAAVRDVDGREEVRRGTVSVFEGPQPDVEKLPNSDAEQGRVADFLRDASGSGMLAEEMGVFVRARSQLQRARDAIKSAGLCPLEAGDAPTPNGVLVTTMHLAKGLEFKAVAVMACDQEVIPDFERISAAADEAELDEVYDTERQLFYVACTRARDRLLVTGVAPVSEFLDDLRPQWLGCV